MDISNLRSAVHAYNAGDLQTSLTTLSEFARTNYCGWTERRSYPSNEEFIALGFESRDAFDAFETKALKEASVEALNKAHECFTSGDFKQFIRTVADIEYCAYALTSALPFIYHSNETFDQILAKTPFSDHEDVKGKLEEAKYQLFKEDIDQYYTLFVAGDFIGAERYLKSGEGKRAVIYRETQGKFSHLNRHASITTKDMQARWLKDNPESSAAATMQNKSFAMAIGLKSALNPHGEFQFAHSHEKYHGLERLYQQYGIDSVSEIPDNVVSYARYEHRETPDMARAELTRIHIAKDMSDVLCGKAIDPDHCALNDAKGMKTFLDTHAKSCLYEVSLDEVAPKLLNKEYFLNDYRRAYRHMMAQYRDIEEHRAANNKALLSKTTSDYFSAAVNGSDLDMHGPVERLSVIASRMSRRLGMVA